MEQYQTGISWYLLGFSEFNSERLSNYFKAISTILNNPHKKSAPPKAHAAVPPVPPTDLPRVRRKDFDSYLRAITPDWENFQRNTELGVEGTAHTNNVESLWSSNPLDVPPTPGTARPLPAKALPPLDTVPPVFFEPGFDLGNPTTFSDSGSDFGDTGPR